MATYQNILCNDLDAEIERHKLAGYRLEMIFPADAPREALLSNGETSLRLKAEPLAAASGTNGDDELESGPPACSGGSTWRTGRAGMKYRDLLTDRLDGRVAVSHIRLTTGGPVPDYVHYHKIGFQMIYCLKGRIKVVYEDQGGPFWLEPGDCVVQPPEIRHRVLECDAGSEVIEVSMPAEHETWVDRELHLPTAFVRPERKFAGESFLHKRSTSVTDLRDLLSLRGLGPESNASLAACSAVEAARTGNTI